MSGLYQDRLRTGSWTSRQRACDIPMNRLSADLNLLSGCAVLGLMCLRWCANFVLQLQGAGGLDNSNMVGGLQGLVELHASGAEKNQTLFLVSLVKCRVLCPESVLTNYRRFSPVFCYGDAALFCAGALDDVEFALAKRALIKPA
jgi:hypothetical protein